MAHYAKVKKGIVTEVIRAEETFFDTFIDDSPGEWIQTSFNTECGEHRLGGTALRKNFAAIGYVYDATRDAFYAPQPYSSWTLDESTCTWNPPVERPDTSGMHTWNETSKAWDEIT